MLRSIIAFTALGVLLFSLSSCGSMSHLLKKNSKTAGNETPAQPKDQVIGTIEMVNPEQHFVLVKTYNRMTVEAGAKLVSHSPNGLKAVLTVTPEHKLNFISADIVEGYPQQGDIVVEIAPPKPPEAAAQPANNQPPPLDAPPPIIDRPPPIVDLPLPEGQLPPPITPPSGN